MNYQECEKLFKTAKSKEAGKPIKNNTRLLFDGDSYYIKLYETDIITIRKDNTIILTVDGFYTNTTKQRINDYTKARIYQRQNKWHMSDDSLYFDGVMIDQNGKVLNGMPIEEQKETEKKAKKLSKMIDKYVKGFQLSIDKNNNGLPYSVGCGRCSLANEKGEALGDTTKNYDHLIKHMIKSHYIPSLLFNAIKEKGHKKPTIIFELIKVNHLNVDDYLIPYFNKRFNDLLEYVD